MASDLVAFLIPYVLAPAVNAMLWLNVIFSPVVGVVSFLKNFGIDLGSPLASMKSAIFACAGVDIWHYWSYLTVIYLAALRQTPTDQVEAARIDGASELNILLKIMLPMAKPVISVLCIFSFMWRWDDFLSALLYINKSIKYPVSLALKLFCDPGSSSDYGAMFAMASLSILPSVIIFIFFQKYLVEGISTSGLKG